MIDGDEALKILELFDDAECEGIHIYPLGVPTRNVLMDGKHSREEVEKWNREQHKV